MKYREFIVACQTKSQPQDIIKPALDSAFIPYQPFCTWQKQTLFAD